MHHTKPNSNGNVIPCLGLGWPNGWVGVEPTPALRKDLREVVEDLKCPIYHHGSMGDNLTWLQAWEQDCESCSAFPQMPLWPWDSHVDSFEFCTLIHKMGQLCSPHKALWTPTVLVRVIACTEEAAGSRWASRVLPLA